ncbi:MAG: acetylxylan esterase [Clostridia bacterium]|nr:acetylxylan esterase [Clostridia bacterium]
MRTIDGYRCLKRIRDLTTPKYAFDENKDLDEQKKIIGEKFIELLGFEKIKENDCPKRVEIESTVQKDGYKQIRFVFESEREHFVPAYLLIPDNIPEGKKLPVAIVLQGHSSGFHLSINEPKNEEEAAYAKDRAAIAVQAVDNGFIALAIEQRGMGENKPEKDRFCWRDSTLALMLGRTIIAERVWDISKAIDCLYDFPQCDTDKILVTGGSGGGTATYYAACYDKRIKLAVPVCAFCSYKASIMEPMHCFCNYIPNAYLYFEMQDLAALIAPTEMIVVTGALDDIFPLHGVEDGYETVKKIYKKAGCEDKCELIVTPKGHYWCVDIIWEAITKRAKKMGWF